MVKSKSIAQQLKRAEERGRVKALKQFRQWEKAQMLDLAEAHRRISVQNAVIGEYRAEVTRLQEKAGLFKDDRPAVVPASKSRWQSFVEKVKGWMESLR